MKIGLITTAMDEKRAGIGWYCYNLLKYLKILDDKNEYILIHRNKNEDEIYKKFRNLIIPYPKIPMRKTLGDNFQLAFKLRKLQNFEHFDVVHELAHSSFFMFDLPFKKVITIHDVIPILFPQTFDLFTVFVHRYLLPLALKRADKVIAVSENTKRDIIKYFKLPEEKIKVIYNGVDHNLFKELDKNDCKFKLKDRYGITSKYILAVGTIEPRKNYTTLVKAYYKLKVEKKIPHKLIIVGKKGWKCKEFYSLIRKLNILEDIIIIGYIPYEDLPLFYNYAEIFVYPSLYEGFGLPVLEAMACGCPVVASNTSSLPEVVGNAGLLTDPIDVDGLAEYIYELLNNTSLRKKLIKEGLKRSMKFNWEETAKKTLKTYEELTKT